MDTAQPPEDHPYNGTSRALLTDLGAARLGTARTTLSVCSRAQLDDLGEMLVDG